MALLLPLSAPAWAQMQNNGNSVIAVPLPPPVVAAPSTPVAPAAPLRRRRRAGADAGAARAVPTPAVPGAAMPPASSGPVVPPDVVTPNTPAEAVPNMPAVVTPGATAPAVRRPPDTMPVIPNDWVPGTMATLGVLNEVDGGTSQVTIPVGGQSQVGDLQVSVQACDMRPPTQLPDTAIFLTVTQAGSDGTSSTTLYRGWMLRSEPGATVVGDGSETFRVVGCS